MKTQPTRGPWIASALLSALAVSIGALDVSAATIAYWRFEPGNLTLDSSGNGNTLTNSGATSASDVSINAYVAAGSAGSVYFNGTTFMRTVSNLTLTPGTQVTVEWFMKPQASWNCFAFEYGAILNASFSAQFNNGSWAAWPNSVTVAEFYLSGFNVKNAVVPGGMARGEWHHYAFELDAADPTSTGMRLYIDGVSTGVISTNNYGTSVATTLLNTLLYIGSRSPDQAGSYFTGYIDEFRVSSGLLDPKEFLLKPTSSVLHTPISATASGEMSSREAGRVIDGSGLAFATPARITSVAELPKHNETPDLSEGGGMWMNPWTSSGWITFDLGSAKTVDTLYIWNCGEIINAHQVSPVSFCNRSAKDVTVYADNNSTPTTLVQSCVFEQAEPSPLGNSTNVTGEPYNWDLNFNTAVKTYSINPPVTARYFKFNISTNWGGDQMGLSEVRFGESHLLVAGTVVMLR